jgi:hypothetical protein
MEAFHFLLQFRDLLLEPAHLRAARCGRLLPISTVELVQIAGDLFLLNDPYTAALHTSDIYLVSPIHHDGKLVAWSACFVHVSDL